jgi:hypothetical protein
MLAGTPARAVVVRLYRLRDCAWFSARTLTAKGDRGMDHDHVGLLDKGWTTTALASQRSRRGGRLVTPEWEEAQIRSTDRCLERSYRVAAVITRDFRSQHPQRIHGSPVGPRHSRRQRSGSCYAACYESEMSGK